MAGVTINRIAAVGFEHGADAYERGRPGYPPAAVEWLAGRLGLGPGRTVVDLGAGTGKLTRLLLATGATVVAIEPVAAMRAVLAQLTPTVEVLDGTAESMPLGDGSVDAVTAAQAFHWFASEAALSEIRRVLRAGRHLGLMWNNRDLSQPLQAALHQVVRTLRGGAPEHRTGAWRQAIEQTSSFSLRAEHHVPNTQELDSDGLVDRVVSTSFVAALPDTERERVAAEVRRLAATQPARFELHYVTDVYVLERC